MNPKTAQARNLVSCFMKQKGSPFINHAHFLLTTGCLQNWVRSWWWHQKEMVDSMGLFAFWVVSPSFLLPVHFQKTFKGKNMAHLNLLSWLWAMTLFEMVFDGAPALCAAQDCKDAARQMVKCMHSMTENLHQVKMKLLWKVRPVFSHQEDDFKHLKQHPSQVPKSCRFETKLSLTGQPFAAAPHSKIDAFIPCSPNGKDKEVKDWPACPNLTHLTTRHLTTQLQWPFLACHFPCFHCFFAIILLNWTSLTGLAQRMFSIDFSATFHGTQLHHPKQQMQNDKNSLSDLATKQKQKSSALVKSRIDGNWASPVSVPGTLLWERTAQTICLAAMCSALPLSIFSGKLTLQHLWSRFFF